MAFCVRYAISDPTGYTLAEDGGCATPENAKKENGGQMSCNGCVDQGDFIGGYYAYGQYSDDPEFWALPSEKDKMRQGS